MKLIRNPAIWWPRLQELTEKRARAIKHHKKRRDLEKEAEMIRTAIIRHELRQERKTA